MMAALDLLGQRWTLRVVWELRDGGLGFRELRRRADQMSSSVLSARLQALLAAGIVECQTSGDYRLTQLGQDLAPALRPLQEWAQRWAAIMASQDAMHGR
jgi:DNA-binding HxlR family transcriptional regulator